MNYSIKQHGTKFVIYDNNKPVVFPNEDSIANEFNSLYDAERVLDIIRAQDYVSNILKEYGL